MLTTGTFDGRVAGNARNPCTLPRPRRAIRCYAAKAVCHGPCLVTRRVSEGRAKVDFPRSRFGLRFLDYEGLTSDYDLWLSEMTGALLRGEISATTQLPVR